MTTASPTYSRASARPARYRPSSISLKGPMRMNWLDLVAYFFGGAFLTNAVPHIVAGMMGEPFQTPFANPPGEGLSTSTVNVLWGFSNLLVGYLLVCHVGDF